MTTVGQLIDRTYRTYLEPPDNRAVSCLLAGDLGVATTTAMLKNFAVPEDEQLIRLGILIQAGSELMLAVGYDAIPQIVTVLRGRANTTPAAHAVDDEVKLSPPYPRQSVFEAVADNIIGLSPQLFQVRTEQLTPVAPGVYGMEDNLALSMIEPTGEIVDYHQSAGGRAAILSDSGSGIGSVWVRYRTRFAEATDESDTLADLGVEERWANIVMIGAAADLLISRDIPATHTEWVGKVLKAENIRVGTRQSVAIGLAQYRQLLIDRFSKEQKTGRQQRVQMLSPLGADTNIFFAGGGS